MLVDNPDIGNMPGEYVENLLKVLTKYPDYQQLALELISIVSNGEGE